MQDAATSKAVQAGNPTGLLTKRSPPQTSVKRLSVSIWLPSTDASCVRICRHKTWVVKILTLNTAVRKRLAKATAEVVSRVSPRRVKIHDLSCSTLPERPRCAQALKPAGRERVRRMQRRASRGLQDHTETGGAGTAAVRGDPAAEEEAV